MKSLISVETPMVVHFYDVDSMNVAWHGNYFRFFEEARCALMDKINFNYDEMVKSGYIWPFVDFKIKYIRPMCLHQKVRIECHLIEYENRIVVKYIIRDEASGDVLTEATSTQVAVKQGEVNLEFESPSILQERVKAAIA